MAQQQVDISSMSLEQLNTYKGQFENEIKQLHARHSGLKQAEGRFRQSKDALAAISKDDEGRRMLVPLTQSLYVPGELGDPDQLLVENNGLKEHLLAVVVSVCPVCPRRCPREVDCRRGSAPMFTCHHMPHESRI